MQIESTSNVSTPQLTASTIDILKQSLTLYNQLTIKYIIIYTANLSQCVGSIDLTTDQPLSLNHCQTLKSNLDIEKSDNKIVFFNNHQQNNLMITHYIDDFVIIYSLQEQFLE